jgi:hypothetical protein
MTTNDNLNPADWTTTLTEGGETFPFVEGENGDITGLGHQDRTAFAEAVYRFELECGMDDLPEDERFDAEHIVHAWVTIDPDNDEILHQVAPGAPGAFAVTGLWGQR